MGSMKGLLVAGLALMLGLPQEDPPSDRLYGRVTTASGDVYEGYLRWDRNEAGWSDVLDGTKELPWRNFADARDLDPDFRDRRERSIGFLGIRISWTEDDDPPTTARSGIRFGHLASLRPWDDDRALLTLKSGEVVEFEGGGSDLGRGMRRLVVEDAERGTVELRWRDLDQVEFRNPPAGAEPPPSRRLYGTLTTRSGMSFTGYVAWDADEVLDTDVLDGEEHGRDREIPFRLIAAVERAGSGGARVFLRSGEEVLLRGSNDVNDRNRGITVSDPELGSVTVGWAAFDALRFTDPPAGFGGYDAFDGGRPLWGTVVAEDGSRHTGYIRWDNDEEATWELLNGGAEGVEFEIEFAKVARIRRLGRWGSEVTLTDGRVFELEDSNDVDEGNKGIYVTDEEGTVQLVRWYDVDEVVFEP